MIMIEKGEFERFVSEMPAPERAVPFFQTPDGKAFTPQEVLDHWDDPAWADVKAAASSKILGLRLEDSGGPRLALSVDFLAGRLLKKHEMGQLAGFFIAPAQRVEAEELVDHVKARDKIGMMRIQAEGMLIRQLARPLKRKVD